MASFQEKQCDGCRHISHNNKEFCYMFEKKPETLPCGQHDKYAEIRKKNGEFMRKTQCVIALTHWAVGNVVDSNDILKEVEKEYGDPEYLANKMRAIIAKAKATMEAQHESKDKI